MLNAAVYGGCSLARKLLLKYSKRRSVQLDHSIFLSLEYADGSGYIFRGFIMRKILKNSLIASCVVVATIGAGAEAPVAGSNQEKQLAKDPVGTPMVYKTVEGRSLHAYVLEPTDSELKHPAIVFFHGGGWTSGSVDSVQQADDCAHCPRHGGRRC